MKNGVQGGYGLYWLRSSSRLGVGKNPPRSVVPWRRHLNKPYRSLSRRIDNRRHFQKTVLDQMKWKIIRSNREKALGRLKRLRSTRFVRNLKKLRVSGPYRTNNQLMVQMLQAQYRQSRKRKHGVDHYYNGHPDSRFAK